MRNLILLIILAYASQTAFAESRVKIAIVDTGISLTQAKSKYLCKDGLKTFLTWDWGYDKNGHGTNIFGLIADQINPKTHCIISYKFYKKNLPDRKSLNNTIKAIEHAIKNNVKYLNMSMGGSSPSNRERALLKKFLDNGGYVLAAAGNESHNLDIYCNYFPACYKAKSFKKYKNFIVVSSHTGDFPNYGKVVDIYEDGKNKGKPVLSGTSQATAIYTGKLVKEKTCGIINSEGKCTTTEQ